MSLYPAARSALVTVVCAVTFAACAASDGEVTAPITPVTPVTAPPAVVSGNAHQPSTVGVAFTYDASKGNTAFSDPKGRGLTYSVTFTPAANGFSAIGAVIRGTPTTPAVTYATVIANDGQGGVATNTFGIVTFKAGLTTPVFPATAYTYNDPFPAHFTNNPPGLGSVVGTDNTPASNPITAAGTALGRALFYDTRLSVNDGKSCGSCHQQALGFSDAAQLSVGFAGGSTGRHSMGLANARFYRNGRFFWDERATTLEAQVLQPIQDAVEMGMSLDNLEVKLGLTTYYPALFTAAFGTPAVTRDRIALALAQFTRALVSSQSRFDRAFTAGGAPPTAPGVLTAQEFDGLQLFNGPAGCARCHGTNAQVGLNPENNGLDLTTTDQGTGGGRFKTPSLRNIAVRPPFMHDGRFTTLAQVVEHYNSGVQAHPNLAPQLRNPDGTPRRLNLTQPQKDALVAFMRSLTDSTFLTDPRYGSPFPQPE